jgi:exopolysaccharide biosynthesis polyprenyl glycosylphosphotransferase
MKNNSSLAYNLVMVVGDMIALIGGFVVAFIIRSQSSVAVANPMPVFDYVTIMLALLPIWILIFALLGLYHPNLYERRFAEIGKLFVGSFIGMLCLITWDYMSLEHIFPAKLVPVYGFLAAFVLLVIIRGAERALRIALFNVGYGLTRIVVIGNTTIAREIIDSVYDSKHSGYELVGVIGYRKILPPGIPQYPSLHAYQEASVSQDEIHGIIQTELYADEKRNTDILTFAQENHISYRFVPGNTEVFVGNIDVELFRSSIPVIHVRHTPLFGWGRIVKRLTDLTLGGLALIIASPLLGIISLIQLFSRSGSVLFTQTRLTRFGTKFKVYKFRSQYQKYDGTTPEQAFEMMGKPELAEQYRVNGDALENDPRVTPLGKFLRTTSLDELPQLFNVLKGDISLVGPRALIPEELAAYGKKHTILSVKSGLTGLAVVSGRRDIPYEERRKLDVYYVQNWSFWLDMIILLKTVRMVISRVGAK